MLPTLPRGAFSCAFLLVAGAAMAHDLHVTKPACRMTYEQVRDIGAKIVTGDAQAVYVEYTGEEARKLIAAINAVEPVSDWRADKIIAIDADDEGPFRVAVIEAGCVTHAAPVPRGVWPALLSAALGDKS
jgi:hypothetical protein